MKSCLNCIYSSKNNTEPNPKIQFGFVECRRHAPMVNYNFPGPHVPYDYWCGEGDWGCKGKWNSLGNED